VKDMTKKIKFKEKENKKCSRRLERALKKLDKVKDANVDKENYIATITFFEPIEDEVLRDLFLEEDYEIIFIE
jgi:hypothetical protein